MNCEYCIVWKAINGLGTKTSFEGNETCLFTLVRMRARKRDSVCVRVFSFHSALHNAT